MPTHTALIAALNTPTSHVSVTSCLIAALYSSHAKSQLVELPVPPNALNARSHCGLRTTHRLSIGAVRAGAVEASQR